MQKLSLTETVMSGTLFGRRKKHKNTEKVDRG